WREGSLGGLLPWRQRLCTRFGFFGHAHLLAESLSYTPSPQHYTSFRSACNGPYHTINAGCFPTIPGGGALLQARQSDSVRIVASNDYAATPPQLRDADAVRQYRP